MKISGLDLRVLNAVNNIDQEKEDTINLPQDKEAASFYYKDVSTYTGTGIARSGPCDEEVYCGVICEEVGPAPCERACEKACEGACEAACEAACEKACDEAKIY